jgi:hypothetical protein
VCWIILVIVVVLTIIITIKHDQVVAVSRPEQRPAKPNTH